MRAELCFQHLQTGIETAQPQCERSLRGALIRVRVPAAGFQHRDARAVGRCQKLARCCCHAVERIERIASPAAHSRAGDVVSGERRLQAA